MTVARSATRAVRRAGSKSASCSTRTPARTARPRDRREVDRPELRRDADARPAPLLPHPDRAVPLVVEARGRRPGHRPAPPSRARPASCRGRRRRRGRRRAGRDGRAPRRSPPAGRSPSRPRSSRGTSRAGGTGSRARPSRRSCRRPSVRIASSGRTRRERRDDPARDGRQDRPTASSSTTVRASHAARSVALFACRVATRSASRTARPSSRSLAALRNALASAVTEMSRRGRARRPAGGEVDVRPRLVGARDRVAVRRRLVQPRSEDQERIGRVEPLADGRAAPTCRPCRGRADGRSR